MTEAATPSASKETRRDRFPVFQHDQGRYLVWKRLFRTVILRGLVFHTIARVETHNLEYIPASGPTLLMMNHRSNVDPFLVLGAVGPRYVCAMSKIENFRIPIVGRLIRMWGVYPVRRGIADRRAIEYTLRLLRDGELVLLAPEGTRHPTMQKARDGLAYMAVRTDATIVPIGLTGTREFDSYWRRLRRARMTLTCGRPFKLKGGPDTPRDGLAHMTREAMYQLAPLVAESQRGVYSDLSQATTDTLEFVT
ncbi:MAG: lysophospholipid acyltransferase family protein [Aggregatilineales bacterium]